MAQLETVVGCVEEESVVQLSDVVQRLSKNDTSRSGSAAKYVCICVCSVLPASLARQQQARHPWDYSGAACPTAPRSLPQTFLLTASSASVIGVQNPTLPNNMPTLHTWITDSIMSSTASSVSARVCGAGRRRQHTALPSWPSNRDRRPQRCTGLCTLCGSQAGKCTSARALDLC